MSRAADPMPMKEAILDGSYLKDLKLSQAPRIMQHISCLRTAEGLKKIDRNVLNKYDRSLDELRQRIRELREIERNQLKDAEQRIAAAGEIYFVGYENYIKIGFSKNFPSRLAHLQSGAPHPLSVYHVMPGTMADERTLHKRFAVHRLSGEWFALSDEIKQFISEHAG